MRSSIGTLLLVLVTGCHHAGTGRGSLEGPTGPGTLENLGQVEFTWQSKSDPSTGTIQATLPDGRAFRGTFLQVTSTVTEGGLSPYWNAWTTSSWGGGGPWIGQPVTTSQFVTQFSGQAIAHLVDEQGTKMRCHFVLRSPQSGLRGGGVGDCQLSTGETVFDAALREGGQKREHMVQRE